MLKDVNFFTNEEVEGAKVNFYATLFNWCEKLQVVIAENHCILSRKRQRWRWWMNYKTNNQPTDWMTNQPNEQLKVWSTERTTKWSTEQTNNQMNKQPCGKRRSFEADFKPQKVQCFPIFNHFKPPSSSTISNPLHLWQIASYL